MNKLTLNGKQFIRFISNSSEKINYYKLFPKTFPSGPPPASTFNIDSKKLRKEYRLLQSTNHPDLKNELNKTQKIESAEKKAEFSSSFINKAYETLSDPLKRSQYILELNSNIDLANDEVGKKLQFQDKTMLLEMMEIHERLENIMNEKDLEDMKNENNIKIEKLCETLNELFQKKDYDNAALVTIRLKYCYNIKNALKEWEAGKPIHLTH